MKRGLALLCALALLSSLCGCISTLVPSEQADEQVFAFTDDLGRSVTVSQPERVAALMGSFAEIWLLAGGELAAATQDAVTERGLELDEGVQVLGSYKEPSLELLLAADPDLVLLSVNTAAQMDLLAALESAGIPAACFGVNRFEDYLHMLDVCTQITGRRDRYQTNGLAVQDRIEQIKRSVPEGEAPRVLLLRASASVDVRAKNSEDTVAGVILKELGCVNIADSDLGLLEDLSLESILYHDPDYIFVVVQGSDTEGGLARLERTLTSDPLWSSLTAVQSGRCHILDKQLFHYKPNARWGESYEILFNILYGAQAQAS